MLRNSLDHGIEESSDDRVAAGKPAVATISLDAFHEGGFVHIALSDDGKGLNREAILKRARERGIVAADQRPSDGEIDRLIFAAGFSTAEQVTALSGRGVGMDVVRSTIEEMRGQVLIGTQPVDDRCRQRHNLGDAADDSDHRRYFGAHWRSKSGHANRIGARHGCL